MIGTSRSDHPVGLTGTNMLITIGQIQKANGQWAYVIA